MKTLAAIIACIVLTGCGNDDRSSHHMPVRHSQYPKEEESHRGLFRVTPSGSHIPVLVPHPGWIGPALTKHGIAPTDTQQSHPSKSHGAHMMYSIAAGGSRHTVLVPYPMPKQAAKKLTASSIDFKPRWWGTSHRSRGWHQE